jgi:hypothetical protein
MRARSFPSARPLSLEKRRGRSAGGLSRNPPAHVPPNAPRVISQPLRRSRCSGSSTSPTSPSNGSSTF